ASFGPTPLAVWSSSNRARSSSSAKPYRVRESSRTTRLVASRAGSPTRSRANVAGEQETASPTPPTSTTAPSGPTAATVPRTLAIIDVPPIASAGGPGQRGRDPGRRATAPHLADREGERVRGVGRPGCVGQLQQPGDHRADLRLARAARAGDRRLHLAR